jgi:zinc transport system substrate-binding protein
MRISIETTALLVLLTATLTACGKPSGPVVPDTTDAPYIVAVNSPLHYFARRLSGGAIEVRLPAPAGTDPAQWAPAVEDVLQLQGAELVLLNGAGYSHWPGKVTLSANKLVVTSEPARGQWIELEGQVTHSHGPEGEHAHGGYAFTTWMDMSLARVQAESIATALIKRWPEKRDQVSVNLAALLADIDALDAGYREQANRLTGRQIIYSHPVYQYFERHYHLPGKSLHWEPDIMPTEEQWQELERLRRENSLFVWEAEPEAAIVVRMTAMGLESVVIDPAANSVGQDWLSVQKANLQRLRAVGPVSMK